MKHLKVSAVVLISSLFLFSCGRQEGAIAGNPIGSSIIVGNVNWKEISSLSMSNRVRLNSNPVGDIEIPAVGSRCTGFLISPSVLMTNQHCIPSSGYAQGVKVSFNHLKGVEKGGREFFICDTFLGNNKKLDFALLECQGRPGDKYGVVQLDNKEMKVEESIYVIQQNCDYYAKRNCDWSKKYSNGKIKKIEEELAHDADTLGGSSGSPVFSWDGHKVVAIHHAGYGNNGMGRGYRNYAVPMRLIIPYLAEHFPNLGIGGSSGGSKNSDNNSMATAFKLKLNSKAKGVISNKSDQDYFTFSLDKRKKVVIKLSLASNSGDLDLYLGDKKGKTLAKSESASKNEKLEGYLKAGTYYVLIKGYRGAKGSYSLGVTD
jgi:V8-like Glu-specific endopeptidase